MNMTKIPATLLLVLLLPALATAQVPPQSIVIATSTRAANTSLVSVDTAGKATTITGHRRGTHKSVALDPNDPFAVWGLGSWPTIGTAPVGHYLLNGLTVNKNGLGDGVTRAFGTVQRCHVWKDQLLITFSSVVPGLYSRPLTGGTAKLVARINEAFDICVVGGKVYVTTWSPNGRGSKLYEVDMSATPAKVRIVPIKPTAGTAPATFKACASMGWEQRAVFVVIGGSKGKLWFVDPSKNTGNAFTVTFGSSRGMAEAIMTHPDQRIGMVVATTSGLYSQTSYNTGGRPFYTSRNAILDVAALGGGSDVYGAGCAGSKGVPQHGHGLNGWPYRGNGKFALQMVDGPPGTVGTLVIGFTKTNIDLKILGAPTCSLYLQIAGQFGIKTDAAGKVTLPAPIPMDSKLIGTKVLVQWGLFEKGANTAGLITTAGLEHTIR